MHNRRNRPKQRASLLNGQKVKRSKRGRFANSGVGHISIGGVADNVVLSNSGVGSIDASKLKALNVKASVSGVGSIDCYASESIRGSVSGVGSLNYGGHPKQKDTKRSGVGSINEL